MKKRPARSQTEIDLLPPWGEPEVITTGDRAFDVAVLGIAAGVIISLAASN